MPLPSSDMKTHYEAVLRDLESQRNEVQQQVAALQNRLKELHNSINTLSKCINPDLPSVRVIAPQPPPSEKYADVSVRWAILDLLHDSQPMMTAEIAEALIAAGIQTRATNFANNVSAVLSATMKDKHVEIQQLPDGKWELTDSGKNAIEHIRTTVKWRMRGSGANARFFRGRPNRENNLISRR